MFSSSPCTTVPFRIPRAAFGLLLLAQAACSDDEATVIQAPGAVVNDPSAGNGTAEPTNGAIMVVGQVFTPDAFNTYVAVFPEVPTGDVDLSQAREFGNANVVANGGRIFVEEEGVMTRFAVDENLRLVEEARFSWANFGIAAINASYTVFASSTRAYVFAPELGVVIVWNPSTMELTGEIPFELPAGMAEFAETYAYDGVLAGDKVIWNVVAADWEGLSMYPRVTLAIANAGNDDPLTILEDSRCVPGGSSRVDEQGNYYVNAGGNLGYFAAYGQGTAGAATCVLRVPNGAGAFDPDYMADYRALTGSYISEPWVHVAGNQYIAKSWDPAVPLPENPDEFWDNPALRPLLVDIDAGTAVPYPDLEGGLYVSDSNHRVIDGVSYYEYSRTGYTEGGNSEIVALHPEGITPAFRLSGFLQGLARVR